MLEFEFFLLDLRPTTTSMEITTKFQVRTNSSAGLPTLKSEAEKRTQLFQKNELLQATIFHDSAAIL